MGIKDFLVINAQMCHPKAYLWLIHDDATYITFSMRALMSSACAKHYCSLGDEDP